MRRGRDCPWGRSTRITGRPHDDAFVRRSFDGERLEPTLNRPCHNLPPLTRHSEPLVGNPTHLAANLERLDVNPERLCRTFFGLCKNLAQQEATRKLLFLTFGSTNRTFSCPFCSFSSPEGTHEHLADPQTRLETTEKALRVFSEHQERREMQLLPLSQRLDSNPKPRSSTEKTQEGHLLLLEVLQKSHSFSSVQLFMPSGRTSILTIHPETHHEHRPPHAGCPSSLPSTLHPCVRALRPRTRVPVLTSCESVGRARKEHRS